MKKLLNFVVFPILATTLTVMLSVTGAFASETRTFIWIAGELLPACDVPMDPPFCPDAAIASSTGDMIKISGHGELTIHPKSISSEGAGTFDADALELGGPPVVGTWIATELLSFKSYGPGDEFGPTVHAGLAMIRIHLLVGGNWVADAVLTLGCILPGAKVPGGKGGVADEGVRGGAIEGVRVNVQGGLNFNLEVDPSATVFIEL